MTDQLPQFVEDWIAEHERELYAHRTRDCGPIVWAVRSDDLRAFLAKFVLCERTSSAVMHHRTGELIQTETAAFWGDCWIALHAPAFPEREATEVPKQHTSEFESAVKHWADEADAALLYPTTDVQK